MVTALFSLEDSLVTECIKLVMVRHGIAHVSTMARTCKSFARLM